jgi:hypothetical protein
MQTEISRLRAEISRLTAEVAENADARLAHEAERRDRALNAANGMLEGLQVYYLHSTFHRWRTNHFAQKCQAIDERVREEQRLQRLMPSPSKQRRATLVRYAELLCRKRSLRPCVPEEVFERWRAQTFAGFLAK